MSNIFSTFLLSIYYFILASAAFPLPFSCLLPFIGLRFFNSFLFHPPGLEVICYNSHILMALLIFNTLLDLEV